MLTPFHELIAGLRRHALHGPADSLSATMALHATSSSEMLGEQGQEILRLQAGRLPGDLVPIAERCMDEVRKVWPGITSGS